MASPGRVLILVENLPVPFDRRVWREARALTERGYRVAVICPRGKEFDRRSREVIEGVSIYRYKGFEATEGVSAYFLEYAIALVKMVALSIRVYCKEGFDVIQTCNPPDVLFFVALPYKILGKQVIFDHHDLSPELYLTKKGNGRSTIIWRILRLFERITFATADVVLSTNESYRKIAMERGRREAADVIVVRNGPEMSCMKEGPTDESLKKGKPFLLYYVGTMGTQDGVDYFLRSIRYLKEKRRRDDFHAVIMGGGVELENLKRYARELRIDDLVTFTGRVPDEDVVTGLSTADVCVCPDPETPLNGVSTMNKTLEYMAMGKPVVAFDLLETRVSAGAAALYAANNDECAFGDRIAELLDSADLRGELGRIGKARVANGLSWEHSKEHLWRAYERAFRKAGGPGVPTAAR
jgi:glycosyltransferase involved in cell wall biosynthesis